MKLLLATVIGSLFCLSSMGAPGGPIPKECQDSSVDRKILNSFSRTVTYSSLNMQTCTYGSVTYSLSDDQILNLCEASATQQGLDPARVKCEKKPQIYIPIHISPFCNNPAVYQRVQWYNAAYYLSEVEKVTYKCAALTDCLENSNLSSVDRGYANQWFDQFKCGQP